MFEGRRLPPGWKVKELFPNDPNYPDHPYQVLDSKGVTVSLGCKDILRPTLFSDNDHLRYIWYRWRQSYGWEEQDAHDNSQ